MPDAGQTNIRNLDPLLWREVRAEAVRHNLSAGELLNTIMNEWLQDHNCATELNGRREYASARPKDSRQAAISRGAG